MATKSSEMNTGFALKLLNDENLTFSERLVQTDKPIPTLKKGQVLVKVLAAPVNPSDLVYLMGKYGIPPDIDQTPRSLF